MLLSILDMVPWAVFFGRCLKKECEISDINFMLKLQTK
jgi:hypothetical protein